MARLMSQPDDIAGQRKWESVCLHQVGVRNPKWAAFADEIGLCLRQAQGAGAKQYIQTQLAIDVLVPATIQAWGVRHGSAGHV